MMLGVCRIPPCSILNGKRRSGNSRLCCRAENQQVPSNQVSINKKQKVVVVGSGWAGLGAAHHLCKQGFTVTVLEGCYEYGSKKISLATDDIGIQGFYHPFRNIFNLIDELNIKPFTSWMTSAQYSGNGLEVKFPVYQELPVWPTPFGTIMYTQFARLPLLDRLTLLPLMTAIIDFDNTDTAWRKYDQLTARELFKQYGCSERFYQDIISPLLQVGLFAPAEQCSAAATLAIIYYFILAHQKDFDSVWCRGTVKEMIFEPWMNSMKELGCKFLEGRRVTEFALDEETGCISGVACGKESLEADAVILAVGISTMQDIIQNSATLCIKSEFLKVLNLDTIDLLTVKLWLDKKDICNILKWTKVEPLSGVPLEILTVSYPGLVQKFIGRPGPEGGRQGDCPGSKYFKVNMPNASNACSGFNDASGWTFFNLNVIHDKHKDDPVTVLQADFYNANELMPLKDEDIVKKVMACLSNCIKDFGNVSVVDKDIGRFPKLLTHYFPGSYKCMMRGSTSFPNLFMAGDWIINRHGSWSQEKSLVTGLEAANMVVDYLKDGKFAKILPVEEDEPQIQALRNLNRNQLGEIRAQLPWSNYFLD